MAIKYRPTLHEENKNARREEQEKKGGPGSVMSLSDGKGDITTASVV
jgi:hypothetical protein